jgi:2-iminoacetate synthase
MHFINENYINSLLDDESLLNEQLQLDIINKGTAARGLTLRESAVLLSIDKPEVLEQLFQAAKDVKERIYGSRIVLFAPLHTTNKCANNCLYCAFRNDNDEIVKRDLTLQEIEAEADFLLREGHKRIVLVIGEITSIADIKRTGEAVRSIIGKNYNGSSIRKLTVSSSPLDLLSFRLLKSYGVSAYHSVIETYNFAAFRKMYGHSPRSIYELKLFNTDRALQVGIEDVGIGVLLGLADYKFETLALLAHASDLEFKYGIGPHTVTIPRLIPGNSVPELDPPYFVDDLSYKKLTAVIRLSLPYTGIILSTRENAEFRSELLSIGITEMSTGSRYLPGNFRETREKMTGAQYDQFRSGDYRRLDEIIKDCASHGYIPSLCTACSRTLRTGINYLEIVKEGGIRKICIKNSISSLSEYVKYFSSDETRECCNEIIETEIKKAGEKAGNKLRDIILEVEKGEKDIYF